MCTADINMFLQKHQFHIFFVSSKSDKTDPPIQFIEATAVALSDFTQMTIMVKFTKGKQGKIDCSQLQLIYM